MHVGLGSFDFSAMHEDHLIGGSLSGMAPGIVVGGFTSCVRSFGRMSSSSSLENMGVGVEFCRISFNEDGTVSF